MNVSISDSFISPPFSPFTNATCYQLVAPGGGGQHCDGDIIELDPCTDITGVAEYPTNASAMFWTGASGRTPPANGLGQIVDSWALTYVKTPGFAGSELIPPLPDPDSPTCTEAQSNSNVRTVNGVDDSAHFPSGIPRDAYPGFVDVVETATTRITTGNGLCVGPDLNGFYWKADGEITETLTEEDTEDDAINRLEAIVGWVPSDCLLEPAFRTIRGPSDTGGGFRDVRTRSNITRAVPTRSYDVSIPFFRRGLASGAPYALLQSNHTTVTADASGNGTTDWLFLNNEPGFETRVQSCAVLPLP